ncbi:Polyketide synthase PksJ [BD1-7 clade bacterium]|uniref:Polyketide synthase PksJ n=1 Tax=BD1-7 clade bacterium TaxID=2029982 RepID=A0A5S9QS87_9GAMM|nr:Polyketide synthase PksJ [BD1-7 clade bacterium]CAA0122300.1 Polyketide synthase PksJ [BD1-7 clade bacterium]
MLEKTLVDIAQLHAQTNPNDIAYTYLNDGGIPSEQIRYSELDMRARTLASVLLDKNGLKRGDRAILLFGQGIGFIEAIFGCFYAGVTAVPVDLSTADGSVETYLRLVNDADPAIVLCDTDNAQRVSVFTDSAPALLQWPVIDIHACLHESAPLPSVAAADICEIRAFLVDEISVLLECTPAQLRPNLSLASQGISSLMAMALIGHIESRWQIRLRSALIFDYPSIEQIAQFLLTELSATHLSQSSYASGPKAHDDTSDSVSVSPASSLESWYFGLAEHQIQHRSATGFWLAESFSESMIETAVNMLGERHDVLATCFRRENDAVPGRIQRHVQKNTRQSITFVREPLSDASILHNAVTATSVALDIHRPLVHWHVFKRENGGWAILIDALHLIYDFHSLMQLIAELDYLVHALAHGWNTELPPVKCSYRDYARWEADVLMQAPKYRRQCRYWRDRFAQQQMPCLPVKHALSSSQVVQTQAAADEQLIGEYPALMQLNVTRFRQLAQAAFVKTIMHLGDDGDDVTFATAIMNRDDNRLGRTVGCLSKSILVSLPVSSSNAVNTELGRQDTSDLVRTVEAAYVASLNNTSPFMENLYADHLPDDAPCRQAVPFYFNLLDQTSIANVLRFNLGGAADVKNVDLKQYLRNKDNTPAVFALPGYIDHSYPLTCLLIRKDDSINLLLSSQKQYLNEADLAAVGHYFWNEFGMLLASNGVNSTDSFVLKQESNQVPIQ